MVPFFFFFLFFSFFLPSSLSFSPPPPPPGSYCVYCPENGDIPCEKVDSFMNEADCLNGVACELPDGTISYAFTAEECRFGVVVGGGGVEEEGEFSNNIFINILFISEPKW